MDGWEAVAEAYAEGRAEIRVHFPVWGAPEGLCIWLPLCRPQPDRRSARWDHGVPNQGIVATRWNQTGSRIPPRGPVRPRRKPVFVVMFITSKVIDTVSRGS